MTPHVIVTLIDKWGKKRQKHLEVTHADHNQDFVHIYPQDNLVKKAKNDIS